MLVSTDSGTFIHKNYTQPELTIIVPTFNEFENIDPILKKIDIALPEVKWEVVFVDDDSPDNTFNEIMRLARSRSNVRLIRRIGRRGLSSAVVEGALSSMAPFIAVMDADMQHDENLLMEMLQELRRGDSDLVIGTRYSKGGGVIEWSARRRLISRLATKMAQIVTGTRLSDPMSGFFMITRESFQDIVRNLSSQGFKILLDIIASSKKPLRIAERPYQFRERRFGESKLDSLVAIEYLMLLLDKTVGRFVPARFIMFGAVGGVGLFVHMAILAFTFRFMHADFALAQTASTVGAMTFNFFSNNFLTYRDRRLKGARDLLIGLISFYAVCSVGAIANVGIANYMFTNYYTWWLSGIAGVIVGSVWNYAATSVFTWRVAR